MIKDNGKSPLFPVSQAFFVLSADILDHYVVKNIKFLSV
jgi:hypothetical protein